MTDDATLGGYLDRHDRPPAFAGSDGAAYSAAIYVDQDAVDRGRHGGAILFVRWSPAGDRPIGHLETPYLVFGDTPEEATARLRALTLYEVKAGLERAIAEAREAPPDVDA